ncbi:MAG: DNA repair protein RecN [Myxococcales bacterium]|nr:DNA repair protein RecN [Myxococcales bacterium]
MLTCLRVANLAIIDHLEVELGPGLNVVTGETGAGKSILITALQLVLGAKGRPELVRTGADEAEVEALFELGDDAAVRERLLEAGLEAGDELVIRRVLQAEGRSRAYVNGRLTTNAQLAALASGLADISSQHQHHSLVDPRTHLDYLDAFAQLLGERARIAEAHGALAKVAAELDELVARFRERADREDLLRFQVEEIDALGLRAGELDDLAEERERLRHAERLARVAGGAEDALYAQDEALSEALGRIAAEVRDAAEIDSRLAPFADRLDEALVVLEDTAKELGAYAREVNLDPERLAEVEDRVDRLQRLQRKYGGDLESILEHRARAADELEGLERHEERLAEAEKRRAAALETAASVARALSASRKKASSKLGERISTELESLGMGGAQIVVDLAPLEAKGGLEVDGARLSQTGIDRAEFLIAPNKGEPARPLAKVASGGELSRAMLAIKRVLAGLGPAGTYVFDEVDTGVGGAVAEVIGRKLHDVAAHHQVICITHLAQIAAYGQTHFRVSKRVVDDRTRSEITRIDDAERLEEIARMVGGVKITQRTRAAAAELLELARR